ncbi:MAG: AAA family ATPase [Bacteroidetes bacterium]|nr:AAA family ATPase [Bacteroidota bacterium]MCL2301969.1 AAA family ATPase [Lentimicrobiaceae bacterium]
MKFSRIKIEKELTKTIGIEEIDIRRLSDVVALVGKNGSGKTRILNLIEENLFSQINISQQNIDEGVISCLPKILEQIKSKKNESEMLKEKIKQLRKKQQTLSVSGEIQRLQGQLTKVSTSLNLDSRIIQKLETTYLKRITQEGIQQLQDSPSYSTEISFESLLAEGERNDEYNELSIIRKNARHFVKKLPHQLALDKVSYDDNDFENQVSCTRYEKLKVFIKSFLKKDLTWEKIVKTTSVSDEGSSLTAKGEWKLDGREFKYEEFSEGEKTLFAYALLFFLLECNSNLNIRESIILIDEPELHLHPDSEIDVINGIRDVIKEKGQLIIATHSINILSTLNYDEIFMVKDGKIIPPSSSTPGESLSELMGMDERVNKLSDFLSSISTWTFVNFITQCFSNPETIKTTISNDPQIEAFKAAIRDKLNENSNMFLDFGAGIGRIYNQLKYDTEFISKINYCALEIDEECHPELKELGISNIYTKYTELPSDSFDFILLCNVLHEIPVEEWKENINTIINSLKVDGYLIIIEAKILNKGEKVGNTGYLVLDKEEIQQLFNLSVLPTTICDEKDKITCVVLNKSDLKSISEENIQNALVALEKNTFDKIQKLREEERLKEKRSSTKSCEAGRKMAFYSQQHINAKIAQEYIKYLTSTLFKLTELTKH